MSIDRNSNVAVGVGVLFASFLSWALTMVSKKVSRDGHFFWRFVCAETLAMTVSGIVLYQVGIIDELKLLSIPLFGGFSVALISSARFS